MPAATIHLRPTAALAPSVLLPGDPGRALALAQQLLDKPLMFNHNRGLWGYTGAGPDGDPLTIQSTGMGGPSAAIVVEELIALGARRLLRTGTCGALAPGIGLGDLLIAREAIAGDGTSRALGSGERVAAAMSVTAALERAAPGARSGAVVSTDLFYGGDDGGRPADALAVEMEAATVLRLAELRGVEAGCLLLVSDVLLPERLRIGDEELAAGVTRLGAAAAAALA